MRLAVAVALVAVMALLPACETEEDDEGSKGLFYKVEGGENEVYLFGSIHFGKEEMYPLHGAVYNALEESDVLGMELDLAGVPESEIADKQLEKGMYQDDTRMTDVVSEEVFHEYVELVEGPGIEKEALKQIKPWFAAMDVATLSIMEAGLDPELGIESYFMEKAEEEGMDTLGLETISDQLSPYDKLSEESQAIYLENSLEEMEQAEEELGEMLDQWKEGDVEAFAEHRAETLEEAETDSLKEFQAAFLDGRDEQMSAEIEELLHDDTGHTYFLVVGALHLAGENSIVERLEEKGYQVTKMY